jgi:hypothetical protein
MRRIHLSDLMLTTHSFNSQRNMRRILPPKLFRMAGECDIRHGLFVANFANSGKTCRRNQPWPRVFWVRIGGLAKILYKTAC